MPVALRKTASTRRKRQSRKRSSILIENKRRFTAIDRGHRGKTQRDYHGGKTQKDYSPKLSNSSNKDDKRKLRLPKSVALETHEAAALRLAHRRSGVDVQDDGIVLQAIRQVRKQGRRRRRRRRRFFGRQGRQVATSVSKTAPLHSTRFGRTTGWKMTVVSRWSTCCSRKRKTVRRIRRRAPKEGK